ncbi:hypothetical protein [Aliiroseovarius sp.]|nr:hypothetical protein [Aliiroseovarius sp.]
MSREENQATHSEPDAGPLPFLRNDERPAAVPLVANAATQTGI